VLAEICENKTVDRFDASNFLAITSPFKLQVVLLPYFSLQAAKFIWLQTQHGKGATGVFSFKLTV